MTGKQNITLTSELSDYIQHVTYDALSPKVVQRAKEAVIDGVGVMLAGHSTDCATLIRRYIGGLGASGSCPAVGDSFALPAEYAALANGVNGHAHDYDDTQISSEPDRVYGLLTHPTTPVLSAALPVAEEAGASGEELLTAFCVGVEVACKMAETNLTIAGFSCIFPSG
jgi:2-methylcitrate dehydratase PrpD